MERPYRTPVSINMTALWKSIDPSSVKTVDWSTIFAVTENFALTLAFFKQLTADKEAKVFTVRIKIKKGGVSIRGLKRKKKGGGRGGIQNSHLWEEIAVMKRYLTLTEILDQMYSTPDKYLFVKWDKAWARKEITSDILLLNWTGPSCTGLVQR